MVQIRILLLYTLCQVKHIQITKREKLQDLISQRLQSADVTLITDQINSRLSIAAIARLISHIIDRTYYNKAPEWRRASRSRGSETAANSAVK